MTPNFHHGAPPPKPFRPLTLIRCPAGAALPFVCLSPDLLSCMTHYYNRRTTPCEQPKCEACDAHIPYRWHSYLAGYNPNTRERFLVEITADVAEKLEQAREQNGTLRGLVVTLDRPTRRPNGRVRVQTRTWDKPQCDIPACPDVAQALCVIWSIPTNAPRISHAGMQGDTLRLDPDLLARALDPGGNGENH